MEVAHPARYELTILRTEIEDDDLLLWLGSSG